LLAIGGILYTASIDQTSLELAPPKEKWILKTVFKVGTYVLSAALSVQCYDVTKHVLSRAFQSRRSQNR